MDEQETRTETFETITVACKYVSGHPPNDEVTAVAWERAQVAVQRAFNEYGYSVLVKQVR